MGAMQRLFQLMAEKKASDIFASVGSPINIKINGVTMPVNQQVMDAGVINGLLQEILSDEHVREFAKALELNFGHAVDGIGNFRFSIFRQKGTPAFVVRYIPADIPKLETLNVPDVLSEIIMEKRGLILIVGATGSGKTTTLTAMLDYRNERKTGHILTLEDPIEYIFKNKKSIINQREIGADTHAFHVALKNALRQAPDCIFIGEIRDKETMSQAIAYAQSGHLCLATLHANNSYHAMSRVISLYPLENRQALLADLAVSLKSIVSQRLTKRPDGTRFPAVEILLNSRHIAELIEEGDLSGIKDAMEQSMSPGSQTFEQSLFKLFKAGIITLDEAKDNADSANNLVYLVNNDQTDVLNKTQGEEPFNPSKTCVQDASFSEFKISMD